MNINIKAYNKCQATLYFRTLRNIKQGYLTYQYLKYKWQECHDTKKLHSVSLSSADIYSKKMRGNHVVSAQNDRIANESKPIKKQICWKMNQFVPGGGR